VKQEAQLSLTNRAMLFCKVVEVLQDVLSENLDKKFTTQVPNFQITSELYLALRRPWAITLNVIWMEREFDAYKLSCGMFPSNYNRF